MAGATSSKPQLREPSEAVHRRHAAPIASPTAWMLLCAALVVAGHAATIEAGARIGEYWSGIIVLLLFVMTGAYSARKRSLWFSVRWLRMAGTLPLWLGRGLVVMDRLESWRRVHITIGVLALWPFWWHMQSRYMSPLEGVLAAAVAMLMLSGVLGIVIQDFLPRAMRKRPDQEVRLADVEARYNDLYVRAEEAILGHSEKLIQTYIANIKPLLTGNGHGWRMLWATLSGGDPALSLGRTLRSAGQGLGEDEALYKELVAIAERKVRLEHNHFNLRFSNDWLAFHIWLAAGTGLLVIFHVLGVLYFGGL